MCIYTHLHNHVHKHVHNHMHKLVHNHVHNHLHKHVHDLLMHNYASDKEAVWRRDCLKCLNLLISKARMNPKNCHKTFLVKIEEKYSKAKAAKHLYMKTHTGLIEVLKSSVLLTTQEKMK